MITSTTSYRRCEVRGGYNTICWNWEDALIKTRKLCVLIICVCTYRYSLGGLLLLYSDEGTDSISSFPLLTSAGRTQQQHINHQLILYFSLPVSLMYFFPSPDHTEPTTNSDQRAASKPEQETGAKGVLSHFLPLSAVLDTSLQTAQASRVLSEAMSAWAGPYLFTFSFIWLI